MSFSVISFILYTLFMTSKPQPWNYDSPKEEAEAKANGKGVWNVAYVSEDDKENNNNVEKIKEKSMSDDSEVMTRF